MLVGMAPAPNKSTAPSQTSILPYSTFISTSYIKMQAQTKNANKNKRQLGEEEAFSSRRGARYTFCGSQRVPSTRSTAQLFAL